MDGWPGSISAAPHPVKSRATEHPKAETNLRPFRAIRDMRAILFNEDDGRSTYTRHMFPNAASSGARIPIASALLCPFPAHRDAFEQA